VSIVRITTPIGIMKELFFGEVPGNEAGKLAYWLFTDPTPGTWKIKIRTPTNAATAIFFQIQTAPTKDPYETIRTTFEGDEDDDLKPKTSQWKEFVYRGLAVIYIIEGTYIIKGTNLIKYVTGIETLETKHVQNNNIKALSKSICAVAVPIPNALPKILLADANGEDELTRNLYSARVQRLYQYVYFSIYRNDLLKLPNVNKADFQIRLQNRELRLVSFGGHGTTEALYGFCGETVLTSQDICSTPRLARGKIFHAIAFSAGLNNMTPIEEILLSQNAIAFIGYRDLVYAIPETESLAYIHQYIPDCNIVRALIDGCTVEEAMQIGKQSYLELLTKYPDYLPIRRGYLLHNYFTLFCIGDRNAVLHEL